MHPGFIFKFVFFIKKIWYIISNSILWLGGITIKKLSTHRKKWLDDHSRKIQSRISSRPAKVEVRRVSRITQHDKKIYNAVAPEKLSIVNNTVITISYFNAIIKEMSKKEFDKEFFFDISHVDFLTTDAIMYILAILKNIKGTAFRYKFSGNQPINSEAKNLMKRSGFYNYVNSEERSMEATIDTIQIVHGVQSDPILAKQICDFVNAQCKTETIFTTPIYKTIIELMTNTRQHAYKDGAVLNNACWYMHVEALDDKIRFSFLDTGLGIPKTVSKKFLEKLLNKKQDCDLISSALKGEFRTETKEKNRGKGLPLILDYCKEGKLENLEIFSGKGRCRLLKGCGENIENNEFEESILGTLFLWEISKKEYI